MSDLFKRSFAWLSYALPSTVLNPWNIAMKRLKLPPLFAVASATFFIACAPASGQVTSVSNSDGTLTISPTTGNVVGSLALAHANTWTNTVSVLTSVGTLNFDFETTNAVGSSQSQLATQGKIFGGSAAHPLTTAVPMISCSRYEAITVDTQGGQNPCLWIESVGNNSSTAGVSIGQVVAVTAEATQVGTGDVVGGYFTSTQNGSNLASRSSAAFGIFISAAALNSNNSVFGLENVVTNNTGQNLDYATFIAGGFNGAIGYEAAANGSNLSTVALWVRSNNGATFDVGVGFNPNSIQTASIRDDSNSVTSYLMVGSHTNGIDSTFGTFSGNFINATGFAVDNIGRHTIYGSFTTQNGGLILLNTHATAGDTAIVLGVGLNAATDTASVYLNFLTPNVAAQAGSILRADAAGTRRVSYNTTSDQRLKVDLGEFDGALDRLMRIRIHKYHGIGYAGADFDVGYFAQELYEQYPWAVTPSSSSDYQAHPWQVDYGRVTPLNTAAIQDLKYLIDGHFDLLQVAQREIADLQTRVSLIEKHTHH